MKINKPLSASVLCLYTVAAWLYLLILYIDGKYLLCLCSFQLSWSCGAGCLAVHPSLSSSRHPSFPRFLPSSQVTEIVKHSHVLSPSCPEVCSLTWKHSFPLFTPCVCLCVCLCIHLSWDTLNIISFFVCFVISRHVVFPALLLQWSASNAAEFYLQKASASSGRGGRTTYPEKIVSGWFSVSFGFGTPFINVLQLSGSNLWETGTTYPTSYLRTRLGSVSASPLWELPIAAYCFLIPYFQVVGHMLAIRDTVDNYEPVKEIWEGKSGMRKISNSFTFLLCWPYFLFLFLIFF